MRSFLTITVPADDLALLTIEEMRAAVGITDNASDDALDAMEALNAASIMSECNIAIGGGYPPTLRREMLSETIFDACGDTLPLSRRHDVVIGSIVEDGVTLLDADFMVDPESGRVTKLCSDYPTCWSARKVVILYDAGFEDVPADLKKVATDFLRASWQERDRDPLVKSERVKIEGVDETERQFWVGSVPGQSNEGAVPDIVAGQLTRFRNRFV